MKGYIIKDNVIDKYYKGNRTGTTAEIKNAGIYKTLKKAIKAIKRNTDPRLNNSYSLYKVTNKGKVKLYLDFSQKF